MHALERIIRYVPATSSLIQISHYAGCYNLIVYSCLQYLSRMQLVSKMMLHQLAIVWSRYFQCVSKSFQISMIWHSTTWTNLQNVRYLWSTFHDNFKVRGSKLVFRVMPSIHLPGKLILKLETLFRGYCFFYNDDFF